MNPLTSQSQPWPGSFSPCQLLFIVNLPDPYETEVLSDLGLLGLICTLKRLRTQSDHPEIQDAPIWTHKQEKPSALGLSNCPAHEVPREQLFCSGSLEWGEGRRMPAGGALWSEGFLELFEHLDMCSLLDSS